MIAEQSHNAQETTEFPSLFVSAKNHRKKSRRQKVIQLSHQLSNEKPFELKYSSKVRKKINKSSNLGTFMNQKPPKDHKNVELHKIMEKLGVSQIVTYKGKKREIPKRKLTRLKKNILRIRAERGDDMKNIIDEVAPLPEFTESSSKIKEELINSIENIKLEKDVISEEDKKPKIEEPIVVTTNPFQKNKEIVQHSRQFRPYCTNLTSKLLCELTETFLIQLRIFQQKKHEQNPSKSKKRYVTGLSEIRKFLEVGKVKLLIIAPDLEPNPGPGGLDETVANLKTFCDEKSIPYLFSLKRRKIGYVLLKKVPVSCVGILSYEGCEQLYGQLMDELVDQVARYKAATIIS